MNANKSACKKLIEDFGGELFPKFVSQSLLFLSFLIATFFPVTIWKLR